MFLLLLLLLLLLLMMDDDHSHQLTALVVEVDQEGLFARLDDHRIQVGILIRRHHQQRELGLPASVHPGIVVPPATPQRQHISILLPQSLLLLLFHGSGTNRTLSMVQSSHEMCAPSMIRTAEGASHSLSKRTTPLKALRPYGESAPRHRVYHGPTDVRTTGVQAAANGMHGRVVFTTLRQGTTPPRALGVPKRSRPLLKRVKKHSDVRTTGVQAAANGMHVTTLRQGTTPPLGLLQSLRGVGFWLRDVKFTLTCGPLHYARRQWYARQSSLHGP
jgi:hypothetical protein